MNTKTRFALAILSCLTVGFAAAQTPAPAPSGQPAAPARVPAPRPVVRKPPSQVDQVIQLVKAHMSEELIIKFLQKNAAPVNLTSNDLVRLQEAGVSERIMTVMLDPTANPPAIAAPAPETYTAPPPAAPAPEPLPPPPTPPSPIVAPPSPAPARVKPLTGDWRAAIQQRIESDYPLTQATGDKSDIVAAGAVIVLKRNSLVMHTDGTLSNTNTYKGGKISAGFFGGLCRNAQDGSCRTFVKGEKFWLTDVNVKDDGLVLQFLSDPLPDSRYSAGLKFPFSKGAQPTPDEMAALVAEVIGADAPPPAAQAPAPAAVPQPAIAPIAPPPPPPGPPPTVAVGQSKDQVIAALGQPARMANVGTKQILFFPNLKVTLVNGKVTEVQ